jgi:hypothetical protein
MDKGDVKVFYKKDDTVYRKILKSNEYTKNEYGQIILPEDHYSKGYIERIIDGIDWEDSPFYINQ